MKSSYTLEKYKGPATRYTCPQCGRSRKFTRYVDSETGEQLADNVGICNRVIKCGYHYKPSEYFRDNPYQRSNAATTQRNTHSSAQRTAQIERIPSYLPHKYLEISISPELQIHNRLILYLKNVLGTVTERVVKRFNVGSAKRWPGATVFWYVDQSGRIRSGKIILYNTLTGKRVKEPFPHITWVHAELLKRGIIEEFNLDQCLFGEHQLIKEPHKPVGIVESEKTAIIASVYLPELTWMACGSLGGLTTKRLIPLLKSTIVLYPDIKGFEAWERKAQDLRTNGFSITVSSLLENHPAVTEEDRAAGLDLADFLTRLPLPLSNFERMESKNPLVNDLVKRFDLVDIARTIKTL